MITDSYASGSADSGFYVGQCRDCDILVTGNVAERNAVGFENANASDSVVIAGNRFSGNRVGLTLLSSYQEAFLPQRANQVVGNLISDNDEADSPAQAEGGFATGVGISGGQSNIVERNRISGHARAGVILTNTEDIPAVGNRFRRQRARRQRRRHRQSVRRAHPGGWQLRHRRRNGRTRRAAGRTVGGVRRR